MKIKVEEQTITYHEKSRKQLNAVLTDDQRKLIDDNHVIVDRKELFKLLSDSNGIFENKDVNSYIAYEDIKSYLTYKDGCLHLFATVMGVGEHECNLFRIEEAFERRTIWLKVLGIITIISLLVSLIIAIILAC